MLAGWLVQLELLDFSPTKRQVMIKAKRLGPAGRAVRTPHVDIDCMLTSDREQAPAVPKRKHARKITAARWLTHDASLTEFKEKEAARVAQEALRGQPRARAPARASGLATAVGRGGGQRRGRGRGSGAAAARVVSDSAGDSDGDNECNYDASEEYAPAKIHDAEIGPPMHSRKE
jgi:hypothetical protein